MAQRRCNLKILFKMITGNGYRITWHGPHRWSVHITGGAKVTGRSVRPLAWSDLRDTLYTVSFSVRRSKLQGVIWRFVVRMLHEHNPDYQPLRHYQNFNVCTSLNDSLRVERCGDRILVEARFSSTVQTGPPIQRVTGLFPRGKEAWVWSWPSASL